ncbi:MAG: dephospho-CoA kinase [Lentimicrobiaceae bacterium]|nr:dephospho-CoA kinase [Lentimicrobiaceae bacterium]
MIKIGLTGSIGSGKSTVAQIFKVLNIPVYHADQESKKFLDDETIKQQLRKCLGNNIFKNTGLIDRVLLAEVVFNSFEKLAFLNSLLHPMVKKDFQLWAIHQQAPLAVLEAAILFESGFNNLFDRIITVSAPVNIRKQRVIERDFLSEKDFFLREQHQWGDEKKCSLSDFIIINDDQHLIVPQVLSIYNQIIQDYPPHEPVKP